ncbi:MAG: endolytic transglycosylase MltG [Ghiorsea sp.]|nr:endolytic transglycosylase MltG [Ghiorsea sp.]
MKKKVFIIFAVVLLALAGAALWIQSEINQQHKVSPQDIEIPNGASSKRIASILEAHKVISSASLFSWYTRLSGQASMLKPGLYHFSDTLNMPHVLNILTQGKVLQFKVTIPEGLRTDEMLNLLAEKTQTSHQDWQHALKNIIGNGEPEGLFLPETYMYNKPINPKEILQQMYNARAKVEATLAQEKGWDEEQIKRNRIMASIVEKETALPKERVWVSAAIHNRLSKNMRLQMDPTVIYGMYRTQGSFNGNIRRKDLRTDTPWNTYTRNGIPPTPICNPGAGSLRATAYPADVDYLYFVADGTGGHAFATTLAEHNANVRQWIRIERKLNRH